MTRPSRKEVFDYTYDGIMRSLELSLERLGLDNIDILYVHDMDVFTHGSEAVRDAHVKTLMGSGYKALQKLRDEKVIKAFGAGINEWQVCEILLAQGDFDIFLLAGRYTLLEQEALNSFLPLCEKRGIGIVLGGPYNSGILATGAKPGALYNYDPAPKHILDRVRKIEAVCKAHKVKLPEAALRFPDKTSLRGVGDSRHGEPETSGPQCENPGRKDSKGILEGFEGPGPAACGSARVMNGFANQRAGMKGRRTSAARPPASRELLNKFIIRNDLLTVV